MPVNRILSIMITLVISAACSSAALQSGLCAPGGACIPRYKNSQVLENANMEELETEGIPNLSGNLGLPNLAPATTCEAASSPDDKDTIERNINLTMSEIEWENKLPWGYGPSVWRKGDTYVFYQIYDTTDSREGFIIEDLGLESADVDGSPRVLETCVFQQ